MKCWRLAQKLVSSKNKKMEVSDEEFGIIRKIVEENFAGKDPQSGQTVDRYQGFVIAQILEYLEEQYI